MQDQFFVVSEKNHNELVEAAYRHRGYSADEAAEGARFCAEASRHGIQTHNAIKALDLDDLFGSGSEGCVPGAEIRKLPGRFAASEVWDANKKLGQSVAYRAMDRCIELADEFGIGQIAVDNAFHYLWGGGYVMDAARRGYLAYTNCTAALTEVVPFLGKVPTLGTNPHSWGFPTEEILGYPIVIDWATSVVAMGRVQQLKREGKSLPPDSAVDKDGNPTTDPAEAVALLPFGAHKGYGLSLINELVGAFIGGSLPTLRSRWADDGEKHTCAFYFQVIHPDAISGQDFAKGRTQKENLKAVLDDIFKDGNASCVIPGEFEARHAERCRRNGGLLFTRSEIEAFGDIAEKCGKPRWNLEDFKPAE